MKTVDEIENDEVLRQIELLDEDGHYKYTHTSDYISEIEDHGLLQVEDI